MEVGIQVDSLPGVEPRVLTRAETKPIRTEGSPQRFVYVDGLRGIAALCILVFHIWWYEPEPFPAFATSNWMVDLAFLRVRGGVQILLVISGFVIAYSLRNLWITPIEIVNFIGRRVIRLVPAYWVAIATVILVNIVCDHLLNLASPFEGPLTGLRVLTHMLFLQDVTGHDPLGAGMWTLCIEMQFYFVAVLGWGLAQRLFTRPDPAESRPSMLGLITVFAPVAFVSLFHWRIQETNDQWVTHFLWMFFLGMSTWWTLDKMLSPLIYRGILVIAIVELFFNADWRYENTVALTTAIAIYAAGTQNKLYTWLDWPWLQYFGRISYSLYLIHFPVCHLLTTIGWMWCDNAPTTFQARLILLTSFFASLVAGHLLYVLVEAPSARWAARMKLSLAERPAVKLPNKPR